LKKKISCDNKSLFLFIYSLDFDLRIFLRDDTTSAAHHAYFKDADKYCKIIAGRVPQGLRCKACLTFAVPYLMGLSKKAKKKRKNSHSSVSDSSILSFLYILLACLFRSFLFPFQVISCLVAKLKDSVGKEEEDNTYNISCWLLCFVLFSSSSSASIRLLAALFRSFFFTFQLISFLFAKFKDLLILRREQQHNTKNDKDFAKLKDSVEEEDNTDSNPKGTYIQTLNHILI
jgi:hypothetical protein